MKQELMNLIRELLYVVVIVVLPVLAKYITKFISQYGDRLEAEIAQTEYNKLVKYASLAKEMINEVVVETNQTFVQELKKNGEFSKETGKEAFNITYEKVQKLLTEDMKKAVEVLYGDINTYLTTAIEKSVNENKK